MNFFDKIVGAFMVAICGFFLFVSVKAIVELPSNNKIIDNAILVEDALVYPENEGKVVAAIFHITSEYNAIDTDLSIEFNAPVARRYVDELKLVGTQWKWEPVPSYSDTYLKGAVFLGRADDSNQLLISPEILNSMSTSKQATEKHFTPESYNRLLDYVYPAYYNTQLWFSEAPEEFMQDTDDDTTEYEWEEYSRYEGARRVRYNVDLIEDEKTILVIGIQQGNMIIKSDELDALPLYEDVDSVLGAKKQGNFYMFLGMGIVDIISLVIGAIGVRKIIG